MHHIEMLESLRERFANLEQIRMSFDLSNDQVTFSGGFCKGFDAFYRHAIQAGRLILTWPELVSSISKNSLLQADPATVFIMSLLDFRKNVIYWNGEEVSADRVPKSERGPRTGGTLYDCGIHSVALIDRLLLIAEEKAGETALVRIVEGRHTFCDLANEPPNLQSASTSPVKVDIPLTEREQMVFDIIRQARGKGITGKEITQSLAKKGILLDQSALTSQIIPVLKELGVKNRRGAGYYFPSE